MQKAFGDAEQQSRRKRPLREIFLFEIEQVVSWRALLALIELYCPTLDDMGRQPYRLDTMLRIRLLQQW